MIIEEQKGRRGEKKMFAIQGSQAYQVWMLVTVLNVVCVVVTLCIRERNKKNRSQKGLASVTTFLRHFTPVFWMVSCVLSIVLALLHEPTAIPIIIVAGILLLYMIFLARRGIGKVFRKTGFH